MQNILLIGGRGLLGSKIKPALVKHGYNIHIQTRNAVGEVNTLVIDLINKELLAEYVVENGIDAVINLVAETNVDLCSEQPELAYVANVETAKNIKLAIESIEQKSRPHLVHVSTDQVYLGDGPFSEEDVCPSNVYGLTKYMAELMLDESHDTIIRTNLVCNGGVVGKNSLSDWIISSLKRGKEIHVFDNILFSPLHTSSIAYYIHLILKNRIVGTFNLGSIEGKSKSEFATLLNRGLGLNCEHLLNETKYNPVENSVKRPFDMRLNVEKFENKIKGKMPTFMNEIQKVIEEFKDES